MDRLKFTERIFWLSNSEYSKKHTISTKHRSNKMNLCLKFIFAFARAVHQIIAIDPAIFKRYLPNTSSENKRGQTVRENTSRTTARRITIRGVCVVSCWKLTWLYFRNYGLIGRNETKFDCSITARGLINYHDIVSARRDCPPNTVILLSIRGVETV